MEKNQISQEKFTIEAVKQLQLIAQFTKQLIAF